MLFEGLAAVWQVTGVGPPSPHSALSLGEFHCLPSLAHVDGLPNPVPVVSRWKRSSSWTTAMGKFDGQALPGLTYVKSFSRWPVTGSVGSLESGIHGSIYPGTLPFRLFGGGAGHGRAPPQPGRGVGPCSQRGARSQRRAQVFLGRLELHRGHLGPAEIGQDFPPLLLGQCPPQVRGGRRRP